MKAMLDRMADTIHCQLLAGKYGCSTATAGSPASDEEATDYLNKILMGFGANLVGQVGASLRFPGTMEAAEKEAFVLGQELAEAIRRSSFRLDVRLHSSKRWRGTTKVRPCPGYVDHNWLYIYKCQLIRGLGPYLFDAKWTRPIVATFPLG